MGETGKSEVLQGTLDLMVLKTLEVMGALHGYGIGERLAQVSGDSLQINPGTLYLCLVRLHQQKFVSAKWGVSGNNRRAKFYDLTAGGRRRLQVEAAQWDRVATVMTCILRQERS